jgi:hypothetical protein
LVYARSALLRASLRRKEGFLFALYGTSLEVAEKLFEFCAR